MRGRSPDDTIPVMTHVVVVGAGPGLGTSYASRFRADGADVTLLSRDPQALAEQLGVRARPVDAGDSAQLTQVLTALDDERPVDVLVFNAVSVHPGPLTERTSDELRQELAVGVEGAWTCVRALLPRMQRRDGGVLLFTGGGAATYAVSGMGFLSPVKAAMRMLVLTLAEELTEGPVRVHTLTVAAAVGKGISPDVVAQRAADLVRDGGPVEVRLP